MSAAPADRLRWAEPAQAVLFDLDGTLADTAGDLVGAVNHLRVQRGLPPMPLEILRPYASAGARGLIGAALDIHPGHAEFEDLRTAFLNAYEGCLADTTVLFDGMAELLTTLEARGIAVEDIRLDEFTGHRFVFFADPDGLPLELYEAAPVA